MREKHPYEFAYYATGTPYHKNFLYQSGGGTIYGSKVQFDFQESENKRTGTTEIFIGDKKECLLITIEADKKAEAYVQTFHHFEHCDLQKKLSRVAGTRILMTTALQYIYYKKDVRKVVLTDKAFFEKEGEKISFFILYTFKYGETYYQKNFGFKYGKSQDIVKMEKNRKIREKHFINKNNTIKELAQYFAKKIVIDFAKNIKDGEPISEFVKRFNCPNELFAIYFAFLEEEFRRKKYNNLFGKLLYKRLVFHKKI